MKPAKAIILFLAVTAPLHIARAQASFDAGEGCLNVIDVSYAQGVCAEGTGCCHLVHRYADSGRQGLHHRMYVDAGLAWTIVRFCGPTDKPFNSDYKIGFGEKHLGMMIPRENIGAFMVEQLTTDEYLRSMPIIGS